MMGDFAREEVSDYAEDMDVNYDESNFPVVGDMTTATNISIWEKTGTEVIGRYSQLQMEASATRPLETLQHQFTYFVQLMSTRYEVFGVVSEWQQQVLAVLECIKVGELDIPDDAIKKLYDLLEKEARTWDLLMRLYFYRLGNSNAAAVQDMEEELPVTEQDNEQPAVDLIMKRDKELWEMNIILKWLEGSYAEKTEPDLTARFVSWEQTFDALQRNRDLNTQTTENMITEMDPDACIREKKELHILDLEEEAKVQRGAFYYIRAGQFNKALEFLKESAHIAKVSALSGCLYTEKIELDTNEDDGISEHSTIKYRIMGNLRRDLWKLLAFKVCELKKQSKYERASLGALCGHRESVLEVAVGWEDKLWTHLKIAMDVRVEEELRKRSNAVYMALPDEYWSQKLTVADCLERSEEGSLGNYSDIFHVVQTRIMLDDVESMMEIIRELALQIFNDETDHPVISGQIARFLTHMILVFGIIGIPYDEQLMDVCSETYIRVLTQSKQLIYTPFYINCISESRQIPVILDQIDPTVNIGEEGIHSFIRMAASSGLDVLNIGIAVVEKLFREQLDFSEEGLIWISGTYTHVQDNRQVTLALLRHAIIIARKYLVTGNAGKVKELLSVIKPGGIKEVTDLSEQYEDTLVKEYICYNAYLEAEDYLQMWKKAMTQKPKADETISKGSVADRVYIEKRQKEFEISDSKWRKAVSHYLKQTIDAFMKILKFPNGWLLDCVAEDGEELTHVNGVRRIIIPKVVFILIKLIQESQSNTRMRELLYTICEDHRQIMKELRAAELASIFKSIESSTRTTANSLVEGSN